MKNFYLAAALSVAGLCSLPAAAADLHIDTAGLYGYATIKSTGIVAINNPGGMFHFTGTDSTGSVEFDAFCIDLAHTVTTGMGSQLGVSYNYNYGTFTSDGFGNPLSSSQISQMEGLATLGFSFAGDTSRNNDLAAIQAAIWQIMTPDAVFTSTNSAVNGLIDYYVDLAPTLQGNVRYIVSVDRPQNQGMFIPGVPGVPEPATWAMLILGFGLVGFSARRKASRVLA